MIATTWKDKQDTFMSRNGGMHEPTPKGVFSAEQMFVRSTDHLVRGYHWNWGTRAQQHDRARM